MTGPRAASPVVGFAVVYRWRIHPDHENVFRAAWETVTIRLREERGALGSRLHRSEDGMWVAYAQWPSKRAWESSRGMESVDPAASSAMAAAIAEAREPLLLTPEADYLLPGGGR